MRQRINWRDGDKDHKLIELLSYGYTHEQIGQEFGCAANSVKCALHYIYTKLGASNAPHAIAIAYQRRILKIEP